MRIPLGRLALVDGRRVRIERGGSEFRVTEPSPVDGLVRVPTAAGETVMGWSGAKLLRFDDAIGAAATIAVLDAPIVALGTWPGAVVVRTANRAVWLDLDGQPRRAPLPLAPPEIAFTDGTSGAAIFPGSGLAATSDGGKTWRSVDAHWATRVDADEGWLRVTGDGGRARRLDAATGGLREATILPKDEPPFLLQRHRFAPVENALREAVDDGDGKALSLTTDGWISADLETGKPGAWSEFLPAQASPRWHVAAGREPRTVLVWGEGTKVLRVHRSFGRDVEEVLPAGRAPHVSALGRVLREGSCTPPGSATALCVEQPDGSFADVPRGDLEAPGPLVDGGVVGVLRDGKSASLVSLDVQGTVRTLGPIAGDARPLALVDQIDVGAFVLPVFAPGQGVALVVHRDGKTTTHAVGDATIACRVGRCVAVRRDGSIATSVGGAPWRDEAGPESAGPAPHDVAASAVGFVAGRLLHVGWGPAGEAPRLDRRAPTVRAPKEHTLSLACERGPAKRGVPYLAAVEGDPSAMSEAFAPPAVPRATRTSQTHGIGAFPVQGVLARDATRSDATLALGWGDHTEIGAHARSARGGSSPGDLPFVEALFAQKEDAVFVGATGGTRTFGRARGGKLVLASLATEAPTSGALGTDGAFAWTSSDGVGFWPATGSPRLLVSGPAGSLLVGRPTKQGVPLLAVTPTGVAMRFLGTEGSAAWLDPAGWQAAPFTIETLGGLPTCRPDAPGAHSSVTTPADVRVDGLADETIQSRVALRVAAEGACVEGLTWAGRERFARVDLVRGEAEGGGIGPAAKVTSLVCKR